jgi:hypothetical protein
MKITERTVELDSNELATAVDAYLAAHRVNVFGPRTISFVIEGERHLARDVTAQVYSDPIGRINDNR